MLKMSGGVLGLGLGVAACVSPAWAAPSNEELHKTVQQLSDQVRQLSAQLAQKPQPEQAAAGSKVRLGGYGEMHYNHLSAEDSARDKKEIDFHRFVLFFGYDFTDKLRFNSEFELEHALAGESKKGEVELEQAYIEFDLNQTWRTRGGVMLVPVGILNEVHEPPTFYGVERNDVESIIIPSTWWAGGAAVSGSWSNGLSWDLMVHEGLKISTTGANAFRVRAGRQKTSEADASDVSATTRLSYNGVPGLSLSASVHYAVDSSQVSFDGLNQGLLYSTHAIYNYGPFGLRALYSRWDLQGEAVEAAQDDRQAGWYVEPSFKVLPKLGVYARYEDVDGAVGSDQFDQWEGGVNYWPHPQVVLKADYRSRSHDLAADEGRDFDGFDLGIGYQF